MGAIASIAAALGCGLGVALPLACAAAEDPLPEPSGAPVLHVHGTIERINADDGAHFDIDMLEQLGLVAIQTGTPWTDGPQLFEGPLFSDVLTAVGASGDTVLVRALNDYEAEIPLAVVAEVPMVLATRRDGARMLVRDNGPLWIVLPFDDRPELRVDEYYRYSVWQVSEIVVR